MATTGGQGMGKRLNGISSMATRAVLAELVASYQRQQGSAVLIESVGGVDAAKRVQAGEAFDLVLLASDAIDRLIAGGSLVAGSRVDLMRSGVAVAVPAAAPRPDISDEAALRRAVLAAGAIGYSTGPSGVQLMALFARWGITEALQGRLLQAPAGVPVASLVAAGQVALGFQQLSELLHVPGIQLLGPMPPAVQINTVFSAGLCIGSQQAAAVQAFVDFLRSPQAAPVLQQHGMAAA